MNITRETSTDEHGRPAMGWWCDEHEEGALSVEPEEAAEELDDHLLNAHDGAWCQTCRTVVVEHPDEGNGPYWRNPLDQHPCSDENGLPAPHTPEVHR